MPFACEKKIIITSHSIPVAITCSQVFWGGESQVCTIAFAISAILHKAKAGEPGITIL